VFELPSLDIDHVKRVADWVELCCLCTSTGVVSRTGVADALRDGDFLGGESDALFPDEELELHNLTFSAQDVSDRFTELVWDELRQRIRAVGATGYPLVLKRDLATRRHVGWEEVPAFTMLLMADLGRSYESVQATIAHESGASRLFEKIVEASCGELLGGRSVRLGWPIEPGWPKPMTKRIERLGERLGFVVETLAGKTKATDKDRGLDVATRLSFGDSEPGTAVLLIQCATGQNWRSKRGEPSFAEWSNIYQWDSALLRAIALPWRLDSKFDYKQTFRFFDAIVLDRLRLCAGSPDLALDVLTRSAITVWCRARLKELPRRSKSGGKIRKASKAQKANRRGTRGRP
jgi:hypothetical protein